MIRKAIIVGMTFGVVVTSVALIGDAFFGLVTSLGPFGTGRGCVAFWGEHFSWQVYLVTPQPWLRMICTPVWQFPTYVRLPYWMVLPAFASYPTLAFIRGPLRRWRRKGLCLKCGYDLTGNESGVCSECGNKIAKL